MIHPARIRMQNTLPGQPGKHIVYVMQHSPRVEYNHALTCAIVRATARKGVAAQVSP